MAEEVSASRTNGNGERLSVTIGSKSIGLAVKDLLPILLLLSGLIGGYLVYRNVMDAIKLIYHRQEQTIDMVRAQTEKIRRMFAVHQFNEGKEAGDQLPLDLEPPAPHAPPR